MIKNKIQSKVAAAFNKKLADAVDTFTCEKLIYSGEFDFETQTYPVVGDESYSGRGVLFGSYLLMVCLQIYKHILKVKD